MKIVVLTLFPQMFAGWLSASIVGRAIKNQLVEVECLDLRDWATGSYRSVDDRPYGGGAGMVIRVDVVDRAITEIKSRLANPVVILLDAGGKQYNQQVASNLAAKKELVFICGHYEGVDQRVREYLADETISIGPYVLSGGEIPAMAIVDSVVRLIPGALGNSQSLTDESHQEGWLEYPQYTRPEVYRGWTVPKVLLSGDHEKIRQWRNERKVGKSRADGEGG